MRVLFRVDGNQSVGVGHISRCVNLAEKLRDYGVESIFAMTEESLKNASQVLPPHVETQIVPSEPSSRADETRETIWAGPRQKEDAIQFIQLLTITKDDFIVVDHYGLDYRWEEIVKTKSGRLLAIDDLANRFHVCDILIDSSLREDKDELYKQLVTEKTTVLAGSRYFLASLKLQKLITASNENEIKVEPNLERIPRVGVYLGGGDLGNSPGELIATVLKSDLAEKLELVYFSSSDSQEINEQFAGLAEIYRLEISVQPQVFLDKTQSLDLFIGTSGVASLERLSLGVPSLNFELSENQLENSAMLTSLGASRSLGQLSNFSEYSVITEIKKALDELGEFKKATLAASLWIDGYGTNRIAMLIHKPENLKLHLRYATPGDRALYFLWANDPEVRKNSLSTGQIQPAEHLLWFSSRVGSKRCYLYLLDSIYGPIGQCRIEWSGSKWELDYSIEPLMRGRGLSRDMLEMCLRAFSEIHPKTRIVATVKRENEKSISALISAGFRPASSQKAAHEVLFIDLSVAF